MAVKRAPLCRFAGPCDARYQYDSVVESDRVGGVHLCEISFAGSGA